MTVKKPARLSAKSATKTIAEDGAGNDVISHHVKVASPKHGRFRQLLDKAINPDADVRWEKDDLFDVIYWIRQVLAVILGLLCGIIPVIGWVGLVGSITINIVVVLAWYRMQRIDEEEYGGHAQLATEGMPPSVGIFLICWILAYSFLHH